MADAKKESLIILSISTPTLALVDTSSTIYLWYQGEKAMKVCSGRGLEKSN
jgi:hypothetical protein